MSAGEIGARTDIRGEHRLAAVAFIDLVGSTEITERIGTEQGFLLIRQLIDLVSAAATARGGHTLNTLGDGLVVLFGAPVTIERASLAACRAGLAASEAVAQRGDAFEARFGVRPQVRVGIAAGEILITRPDGGADGRIGATGTVVSLAARLQALAPPGGVVCSKSVADEVGLLGQFRPLGAEALKGFAAPVETFLVEKVARRGDPTAGHALHRAGFVGRAAELDRLEAWLAPQGERAACLIVGQAGIGKSRLVRELLARHPGRRPLVGSCYPEAASRPLTPLVEILRSFANWRRGLDAEAVAPALAPLLPGGPEGFVDLAELVADQAPVRRANDLDRAILLRRQLAGALAALAARGDHLVVVEDLHWIDPLSADVLQAVIREAPVGLRLLGTSRPDDRLRRLLLGNLEIVEAGPLAGTDISAIARSLMGAAAGDDLVDRVADRSEGNPFFAIEILDHVASRGGSVEASRVGSIENVALSRFDRLDPEARRLLQVAAVLGRSFEATLLSATAGVAQHEVPALVEAAEGILEPPEAPAGAVRFHHVLFRDSIYATIPTGQRQSWHLAAARTIEAGARGDDDAAPVILAGHYEKAEAWPEAVAHLYRAARGAYDLYALQSCDALMERAFAIVETHPGSAGPAELSRMFELWMRCLDLLGIYRRLIEQSGRWWPRLEGEPPSPSQVAILAMKGKAHCHGADYPRSLELVDAALGLACRLGDPASIAYARVVRMRTLVDGGLGSLAEVEELFEQTREVADTLGDVHLSSMRMYHMIAAYRGAGRMGRAIALAEELRAYGERENHIHAIVMGNWALAVASIMVNDPQEALGFAEASLRHAVPGTTHWRVGVTTRLAARLRTGADVPAAEFERIAERSAEIGDFTLRNAALMNVPVALFRRGRIASGWRRFRKLERIMARTGHAEARRNMLLYRAELLLSVAGLIPSGGPRPKLGPADVAVALALKLVARPSAAKALAQLLAEIGSPTGHLVARAEAGLGLLDAARGRHDRARERFDRAERLFRQEGLAAELARLVGLRAGAGLRPSS